MKKSICKTCRKEFNYYPSASKGNYCSYKCYWISKKNIYPEHTGGKKKPFYCMDCGKKFNHRARNTKRCMDCRRLFLSNKYHTPISWPLCKYCGKKLSIKRSIKKSCSKCYYDYECPRGEKHHNWRGGIGTERHRLMGLREYIEWRSAVFKRDNFTCQECGQYSGYLQADHIKPWSLYPKLRYVVSNGKTLCYKCHKETDTWGFRCLQIDANQKEVENFISS